MTLRHAITAATQRLATNPDLQPTAARDAEHLLLHRLSLSRATFLAHPEHSLPSPEAADYEALIIRRFANEPIQYITGQQEFYGLLLRVTPAVLIPRPETEHLVEAVLSRLPKDRPLRILDVGTGSGAIAVALAAHLPHAQITALDISPAALEVAQSNACTHRLQDRIAFAISDLLTAVPGQTFDCIVSNPPYVPLADRPALHPQVRDFEPEAALYAGMDGLDLYRRLIPAASTALIPGGLLALEIGCGQSQAITCLLAGWQGLFFQNDLQGVPRVVLARCPA